MVISVNHIQLGQWDTLCSETVTAFHLWTGVCVNPVSFHFLRTSFCLFPESYKSLSSIQEGMFQYGGHWYVKLSSPLAASHSATLLLF